MKAPPAMFSVHQRGANTLRFVAVQMTAGKPEIRTWTAVRDGSGWRTSIQAGDVGYPTPKALKTLGQ